MCSKIEQELQKGRHFPSKLGQKGHYLCINHKSMQCEIPYTRIIFCKNVVLYTINNVSVVFEIIFS